LGMITAIFFGGKVEHIVKA